MFAQWEPKSNEPLRPFYLLNEWHCMTQLTEVNKERLTPVLTHTQTIMRRDYCNTSEHHKLAHGKFSIKAYLRVLNLEWDESRPQAIWIESLKVWWSQSSLCMSPQPYLSTCGGLPPGLRGVPGPGRSLRWRRRQTLPVLVERPSSSPHAKPSGPVLAPRAQTGLAPVGNGAFYGEREKERDKINKIKSGKREKERKKAEW